MAEDFASQLIGGTEASIQGSAKDFQSGVDLMNTISNIKTQRAQIDQKKQEIQLQKFDKVGGWFETASKMPDGAAKKAFVNDYIPKGISALGMDKHIDPTSLKMMTGNPELASYLKAKVTDGSLSYPDMIAHLKDPEKLAALLPDAKAFGDAQSLQDTIQGNLGDLEKDYKTQVLEKNKFSRTQEYAGFRGQQVETQKDRLSYDVHQKALNSINSKPVQTLLTGYQNLDNAVSNFEKGGATPGEYHELQQAVRSNLGVKGAGGVEERAKTYAESAGINTSAFIQFLTGDPQSVLKASPKLAEQIVSIARLEMDNKKKQAEGLINTNAKGYKTFYSKNPNLKDDFEASKSGIMGQFQSAQPPSEPRTLTVQGKNVPIDALKQAYKNAGNPQQFLLDMGQATGKSKAEVLKLLGE